MINSADLLQVDDIGRTTLFYAAAKGDLLEVSKIIYSLAGTGLSCQRLSLINHKDQSGITAVEVAEKLGHEEIRKLLVCESIRMEYYE
ncbi:MAG: hypothetical protein COA78_36880 [Blastopirellula sp.]|nr:MAG: hypothetical protein COA78_36880 [Blastopirellula sp.]